MDTISDDSSWTKDELARNNFGCSFASCPAALQDSINLVFNNVMSYHLTEPQDRLSPCQKDRTSSQADTDRAWLLTRQPIHVNAAYSGGTRNGRFSTPYTFLQNAIDGGGPTGRTIVLEQNSYLLPNTFSVPDVLLVTRTGPSTVDHDVLLYTLPTQPERTGSPDLAQAIRAAQAADTDTRQLATRVALAEKQSRTPDALARLRAEAEAERTVLEERALASLKTAFEVAKGEDRAGIAFEMRQRSRDAGRCLDAIGFFELAASETGQPHLRERALRDRDECQKRIQ